MAGDAAPLRADEPSVDGDKDCAVLTEFDIPAFSVPPAQGVGGFGLGADEVLAGFNWQFEPAILVGYTLE